jgi:hypothetical protein
MRVEWVHPSWRDLVIDHLADDPAARSQFLSGCGAHGALLALSSGGGNRGNRELPLLTGDADWDALTDRIYRLAPDLDTRELFAVLDSISHAITVLDRGAARLEAEALARTVLTRIASHWDATNAPIALPALEAWLALADRLPHGPASPAPPDLKPTWAELLPVTAPDLTDRDSVERFADWLTFADLLREHRPDHLHRFRFRNQLLGDHMRVINMFLDRVDEVGRRLQPACREQVERALDRIETLAPELADLSRYFLSRLRASRARLGRDTPHRRSDPIMGEAPGWRLFDVERVLRDL